MLAAAATLAAASLCWLPEGRCVRLDAVCASIHAALQHILCPHACRNGCAVPFSAHGERCAARLRRSHRAVAAAAAAPGAASRALRPGLPASRTWAACPGLRWVFSSEEAKALGRRCSCAKIALEFGVPIGNCAPALRRRSAQLPVQFAGQPSAHFGLPLSPPQPPQAIVVFWSCQKFLREQRQLRI
jgi:hypothetical protein